MASLADTVIRLVLPVPKWNAALVHVRSNASIRNEAEPNNARGRSTLKDLVATNGMCGWRQYQNIAIRTVGLPVCRAALEVIVGPKS